MKERTWLSILLSYAGPCRGKMAASVALAVVSVAGGFVPYLGVYQILRLFVERRAGLEGILLWCGVCLAGYAVKVAGYALSTMLAHVSAYTILEGLRLQVADQLMRAPLGEVESRPIGAMKSTIVDRIEDVEPPLAHMIPELSSNLLLPLAVVIAMFAIDWRMGLALLVTIPVALVPMAAGMRSYNKNYAAYMAANNHVNSVIVEYVEGIQVVKAFSQGERSYAKFAQAVSSFRDFTLNWFRCTWASMNLCLSIQTFQECVHSQSYSYMLDSICSPTERNAILYQWKDDEHLLRRNTFIGNCYNEFQEHKDPTTLLKVMMANFIL